ncbi:MAG TPA: cytochrome c1 [Xanthomonadaceae bacterium]|nr:cytochrome c1 [Xanthomonadaceae bacterium]
MTKRLIGLILATAPALAIAAGGGDLEAAQVRIGDRASLQRGATLFVNYCLGCHSLDYLRYSRVAEDLGLSEEQVTQNLNFGEARFGEPMGNAMDRDDGTAWFGAPPPDLSVVSRVRGSDWIFSYLKGFYIDESRPMGWNNTVFPSASMPHVLWELQGVQHAVEQGTAGGPPRLALVRPGRLGPAQYDQVARDIAAFLQYAGEPAVLERRSVGVWVMLFLAVFTFLAWLLKKEYWRDVH